MARKKAPSTDDRLIRLESDFAAALDEMAGQVRQISSVQESVKDMQEKHDRLLRGDPDNPKSIGLVGITDRMYWIFKWLLLPLVSMATSGIIGSVVLQYEINQKAIANQILAQGTMNAAVDASESSRINQRILVRKVIPQARAAAKAAARAAAKVEKREDKRSGIWSR